MTWSRVLGGAVAGWLAWTLLEYVGHRWVMHGSLPPGLLRREHRAHHAEPRHLPVWRSLAHVIPGLAALAAAVVVVRLVTGLTVWPVAAGLAVGGASYVVSHQLTHATTGRAAWRPLAWRAHLRHHGSSSGANFGFTTVMWDRVFGTYRPPD
jgi:sterol desaturase/sphingolipid hydroxylase (fatty acid hydroxylase superfamily)